MKILMVNKFLYQNGGSETYMLKLGDYLASLGHEVQYFGMDHPDRCVGNRAECYTENMDFHNSSALKKLSLSLKTIYSKEARKKIAKVLEDFRPDVVHLNNINFQLTPSIIFEIKKHGIPIVQTVHDSQIACPNHRLYIESRQQVCTACADGNYINCTKNKCVDNSMLKSVIAATESYIYHIKNTYALINRFISPSQFMADRIIEAGIDAKRVTVLHNYSDKQSFTEPKDTSKKYVLYFGRLSIEKGIYTLINACRELKDISFVFAGTGPLAHLCDGIENISAVGFKTGDELKALVRNAMFSVCPSEWHENCSMTILESLSLGTPVIGSDLGGTPELIIPEKTGLIFKAGDKEELKKAILKLYNNPHVTTAMSEACIEASTNNIEKYSEKLINIYNNVIEEEK